MTAPAKSCVSSGSECVRVNSDAHDAAAHRGRMSPLPRLDLAVFNLQRGAYAIAYGVSEPAIRDTRSAKLGP